MNKEVKVTFLSGLSKSDFEDIKDFGYEVDIPDSEEPRIMNSILKPEDYIIIFAIHFSLKVADELTNKLAKKLAANFYKVIKKLWTKFKNAKPCLLEADKEPVYKLPKAVISFEISANENSTLEITNDLNEKEIELATKAYLKLIKLQYKNRKKENELKKRMKK